ncbi:MAG TPA: caspase family protein [Polyangiaceae bacterium]|nr:caspase family protein [Polyangiaceae bacterium]
MRFWQFLVFAALLTCSSAALGRVQRFALIIGNDRGHAPDIELRYAETDAGKVAQVLRDLGGFEPADTVTLRGEDAQTVRSSLISLNDRIRAAQAIPGQQALLFVYYSGHADAEALRLGPSRLAFRELAQLVRGSAANFRLMVVDACRSGALTRLKGGHVVAPFDIGTNAVLPGEGVAFLTASAANEDAQESDEIRGSFFTQALVSGLLGVADRDRDGAVTLDEAYGYARDATIRATSRTFAGPQHPSFQFELRGQGSLVLTQPGAATAQRARLLFAKGIQFLVMARDADGVVVGEVEATSASPALSLRPGRYFVRGRARDSLLEGEVELSAGTTKTVSEAELTRIAYAPLVRKGAGVRLTSHALEAAITVRTRLANADNPCWGGALGYRLELPELSFGLRLGACHSSFRNRTLQAATNELSAAAELRHAWDLPHWAFFLAMELGVTLTQQSFDVETLSSRASASPLGGLGAGVVLPVGGRYFLALEGLAELQVIRIQPTSFTEPTLRWAFAPRALLSVGAQL